MHFNGESHGWKSPKLIYFDCVLPTACCYEDLKGCLTAVLDLTVLLESIDLFFLQLKTEELAACMDPPRIAI